MRNKLFIEALCTFFLCAGSILTQGPIPIAALLCALIYLGAAISGAHYNPAVSLAVRLRRRAGTKSMFAYMAVQFAAAILAAVAVGLIAGHDAEHTKGAVEALSDSPYEGVWSSSVVEILGTFLLVLVILMVGTSRLTAGNSYFGVAIALTVLGFEGTFAEFTPTLNPAVTLGSAFHGVASALFGDTGGVEALIKEGVYLAKTAPRILIDMSAQLVGGVLAAFSFRMLFPEDR